MFRRRRRQAETEQVETGSVEETPADPEVDGAATQPAAPPRPQGPWDTDDAPDEVRAAQRLDLGGISVPVLPGLELRIDMDQQQKPVAATVVSGQSVMQVNAFAAPRTEGIWGEVRAEILASLQAGGAVEAEGPWGPEVHSKVPVGPPVAGRGTPVTDARFIGIDGPRWFLRGLISGPAAVDRELAAPFEEVLRGVVVVRGGEAMPPREPLPLVLPKQVQEAAAAQAEQQAAQQQAAQQQAAQQQALAAAQAQRSAQQRAGQQPEPGQPQPGQSGQERSGPAAAQEGAGEPATGGGAGPSVAPRASMADQLAAAARAVAARQAGSGQAGRAPAAVPPPGEAPPAAGVAPDAGRPAAPQPTAPEPAEAPRAEEAERPAHAEPGRTAAEGSTVEVEQEPAPDAAPAPTGDAEQASGPDVEPPPTGGTAPTAEGPGALDAPPTGGVGLDPAAPSSDDASPPRLS